MQSGLRLHARPEVDLATEEHPRALLHMAVIAVVVRDGRKRRRQENFRHLLCGERRRPTAGLVGICRAFLWRSQWRATGYQFRKQLNGHHRKRT